MNSKRLRQAAFISCGFVILVFLGQNVAAQFGAEMRWRVSDKVGIDSLSNRKQPLRRNLGRMLAAKQIGQSVEVDPGSGSLMDGSPALIHRRTDQPEDVQAEAVQNTIPFWTDSFAYHGLTYTYSMVGTDPKEGSKTTVIPTVLIPLRFVFPDGQVFDASTDLVDGQTSIDGIKNSPIFKDYDFVVGGVNVGRTQFGDAFQRANFWDSVSNRSRNYHVLLGQPVVAPTQTVVVPDGAGHYETDFFTGLPQPVFEESFLEAQTEQILGGANVQPNQLPIVVWGAVTGAFAFAWHGAINHNGVTQTHIGTSYNSQLYRGGRSPDSSSLSHEIIEWLDDPFGRNFVPGWNYEFLSDSAQCDSRGVGDLLETADPAEIFDESVVALPSSTYHVVEGMFIDFYTRANRSRSVNGQYSMFEIGAQYGLDSGPTAPCTGHVGVSNVQIFSIAGSTRTRAFGINNLGAIVGQYEDPSGAIRGYMKTPTSIQLIDFPGALVTVARKINDSGLVVGYYSDTETAHGLTFKDGRYTSIDVPNSLATLALGVNRSGDITGSYLDSSLNLRGFLLRRGVFTTFNSPFRRATYATGINAFGDIVGFAGAVDADPYFGFLKRGRTFSSLSFPGSGETLPRDINDQGSVVGQFFNTDGYADGFVTILGYPYEVRGFLNGLNSVGQIVGYGGDGAGGVVGFSATLPDTQNSTAARIAQVGQNMRTR